MTKLGEIFRAGTAFAEEQAALIVASAERQRPVSAPIRQPQAAPRAANDNAPVAVTVPAAVTAERFDLTWFDEIEESEPKEAIIQGAFGVGEFSTISGLPGTGKSVITTDAACHVAAGLEWHGRNVRQGLVVYIAAERKKLTERRMNAFRKRHGVKDVPLLVLGGRIDLTTNLADAKALIAAVKQAEFDCGQACVWIIIDTLTRTFGAGDQNTSKDMTKYVLSCDELVRGTGAHVTTIHHTAWSGERGKGAIDLDGAVDASFIVKKAGRVFSLECNGTNDGEEGTIVNFTMESVQIGVDTNGEPSTAPVVVKAGAGPAESLLAAMRGHTAKAFDSLRVAIGQEGTEPEGDHFPDNVLVVTEDQWRRAYYSTDTIAKPDTMAKRFKRARTDMLANGTVRQVGQWYWPE